MKEQNGDKHTYPRQQRRNSGESWASIPHLTGAEQSRKANTIMPSGADDMIARKSMQ